MTGSAAASNVPPKVSVVITCHNLGRYLDEAVDSPRRLTDDPAVARRLLDLCPKIPRAVWGRDELRAGERWNSNSVIAWLIAGCGLHPESIHPPAGGRAPGWHAGVVLARRHPPGA